MRLLLLLLFIPIALLADPPVDTRFTQKFMRFATDAETARALLEITNTVTLSSIEQSGATNGQVATWDGEEWSASTPQVTGTFSVSYADGSPSLETWYTNATGYVQFVTASVGLFGAVGDSAEIQLLVDTDLDGSNEATIRQNTASASAAITSLVQSSGFIPSGARYQWHDESSGSASVILYSSETVTLSQ